MLTRVAFPLLAVSLLPAMATAADAAAPDLDGSLLQLLFGFLLVLALLFATLWL